MTRAETLDKAKENVCGHREQDYGSPEDSFQSIAALWTAYKNVEFTATDIAMMMALLKIARIKTGTATEDSFVDLAGYAACGAEIATKVKAYTCRGCAYDSSEDVCMSRNICGPGRSGYTIPKTEKENI